MIRSLVFPRPLAWSSRRLERRRIATCCEAGGVTKVVSSEVEKTLAYKLRVITGGGRGEGADGEAVQVAVVGRDGAAFLRRIPVLPETGTSSPSRLFDRGNYDTVTFEGPDVRPVASLLLAPETGTWTIEEATLSWPDGAPAERFVPGRSSRQGCELLPAAPPRSPEEVEARPTPRSRAHSRLLAQIKEPLALIIAARARSGILRRSGPAAPRRTAPQALRVASMRDYASLKVKLVTATAAIVAAGTLGVFAATGDVNYAAPFAAGGAVGLTYLGFLGKFVDVLGPQGGASGTGEGGAAGKGPARSSVSSAVGRLGITFILLTLGAKYIASGGIDTGGDDALLRGRLAAGAAGFFCYRLAVASVAIALELSSGGGSSGGESSGGGDGGSGGLSPPPSTPSKEP